MEFLVHVTCTWPGDGPTEERDRLMGAERRRVDDLVRTGTVTRIWRDPGRWASWMLWDVASPDELDAGIRSLPMFPWLTVAVHGLAAHPSSPERRVPGRADSAAPVRS